jgi:ADP-ribose pyrophosphatase
VLVVQQYKYGCDAVALQLPAGYIEAGETPKACARRELLEETGHSASSWEELGSYWVDGNRGLGRRHLYLARGAREVQRPAQDEYEQLVVRHASLPEIEQMLYDGSVVELGIVAAISLALLQLRGEEPPTVRAS